MIETAEKNLANVMAKMSALKAAKEENFKAIQEAEKAFIGLDLSRISLEGRLCALQDALLAAEDEKEEV
jgi:hypothetical protein